MKYNFTTVKILDIEGKEDKSIGGFYKILANTIYEKTKTVDLLEKARQINAGEEVELNESETKEIKEIVGSFVARASKPLLDYIDSVKPTETKK